MENIKKSLVVITWNGVGEPFGSVEFDADPAFEILLFNYSGMETVPGAGRWHYDNLLNAKTECKGQVLFQVDQYLKANGAYPYQYISFIDDDILVRISDINYMLRIARVHGLDAFHPSVSHDSFYSYRFSLNKPSLFISPALWIEIMSPFYRKEIFDAAASFFSKSVSGYGLDKYVIPFYQKILKMDKTAIIHAVMIKHHKPVTSDHKTYRHHGLTASEEAYLVKKEMLDLIEKENSGLFTQEEMYWLYDVKGINHSVKMFQRNLKRISKYYLESLKNVVKS
ncbi:MAG: hypothetical protein JWN76_941 [Chitinophagaceae bacterium]|nr:hypothetical protein [Chitinophagaceae bacterium]